MRHFQSAAAFVLCSALLASAAQAHFIWVVTQSAEQPGKVLVYFSEEAAPDDPQLLNNIAKAEAWVVGGMRSKPQQLTLEIDKKLDALVAELPEQASSQPVVVRHSYGILSRGETSFQLNYYAKGYAQALPGSWQAVDNKELLPFEIVPELKGKEVVLNVLWQGKPVVDSQVIVEGPGLQEAIEGQTDEKGRFVTALAEDGLYSIRARLIDETAGEVDGKAYQSIRHYTTLSLPFSAAQVATNPDLNWKPLSRGITSFGGAVVGDHLYVYGGQHGAAHQYSEDSQSGDFHRLNLRTGEWETLPSGPSLAGLALEPYQGKLYRVGGFTVKAPAGEDATLWSQTEFARFDPETNSWESLPALPAGRSSHDAAVIGSHLYVVGGWTLQGDQQGEWHTKALVADLSQDQPEWKEIAAPPFQRRALAVAAHEGKLYVLGGMQESGGVTSRVAVYDPAAQSWSEGPEMIGSGMDGFGSSAFSIGGKLYATTMSGAILRLNNDGSAWEFVGQLEHPRFFHRILPWENSLVVVGGGHMSVGKIEELEQVILDPEAQLDRKAASLAP